MKSWDPLLLPHLKMERTEWGMFNVERGLKIMTKEELGVLCLKSRQAGEKGICRVLRGVRKQTSFGSREENLNLWVHNLEC